MTWLTIRAQEHKRALDRMVQFAGQTKLDAGSGDYRADLADSLPDYHRDVRICLRAGVPGKGSPHGRRTVRHQPRGEPFVHANLRRTEERAFGGGRCEGKLWIDLDACDGL